LRSGLVKFRVECRKPENAVLVEGGLGLKFPTLSQERERDGAVIR